MAEKLSFRVLSVGMIWSAVGYVADMDWLRAAGLAVAVGGIGMFLWAWGAAR